MGLAGATRELTDDVLTLLPRARSVRAYWDDRIDQLAGADPGLTQLRLAIQSVASIAAAAGLAYAFVQATGALQLPPGAAAPAAVTAHNHAVVIVAMLLAGIIAQLAGFQVTDRTVMGQVLMSLWLPVPMLAAMTVGITLGPYRIPSLVWLVVLLSVAVWLRRFGRRGTATGIVAFNGGFLGFFLTGEVRVTDVGWAAAFLGSGILASLAVRLAFFRPDLTGTLARMRRSWEAMAVRLLELCLVVLDPDGAPGGPQAATGERAARRLQRQLIRLNECSLMVDAQIADSLPAASAHAEAQLLFDADLSLSNLARFAAAMRDRRPPASLRREAVGCIDAVLRDDPDAAEPLVARLRAASGPDGRTAILARRLGGSAAAYLRARAELIEAVGRRERGEPAEADRAGEGDAIDGGGEPFSPAVGLAGDWLPGSTPVSTEASTTPGRGGALDRVALAPHNRAAIQIAVAAAAAIVLGDWVSGSRLYWAVLATFLAFLATTNSGEQVRKAMFRAGGTAIGIVLGDLLVHVTGGRVWASLLIVLVSLFFGIYLIRVNYMFMVIGVTVTMSQLYVQFAEFSWHLLVLRLAETAIGVGAVVVTVLVVVPLRPQRVLITGTRLWFRELSQLVDHALDELTGAPKDPLRPQVRDLDAAYAALESTAAGLRRATFGRTSTQLADVRSVSAAARNYARSLANGVMAVDLPRNDALAAAAAQMRESMAAITARLEDGTGGTYMRCASSVELAGDQLGVAGSRAELVLADLTLLDAALARLARSLQMGIADRDTAAGPETAAGHDTAADRDATPGADSSAASAAHPPT